MTTKRLTADEKKAAIASLFADHESYFKDNNIQDPVFIPKMAYRPSGKDELHIGFFPNELKLGVDIYLEFVSNIYEPEDVKRTLYKFTFNPYWEEEYELIKSSAGFERHMVPVSELKIIKDITYHSKENDLSLELDLGAEEDEFKALLKILGSIDNSLKIIANKI